MVIEPEKQREIEAITWNWEGTVLYGAENCHKEHHPDNGHDKHNTDCGIKLWAGKTKTPDKKKDDLDTDSWTEVCKNLNLSDEIEALESLPTPTISDDDKNKEYKDKDWVLIGFHGSKKLRYALITIQADDLTKNCEFKELDDIDSGKFNDIEGLAFSFNKGL